MKSISTVACLTSVSLCTSSVSAFVATGNGYHVRLDAPSAISLAAEIIDEIPERPTNLSELTRIEQSKALPFLRRPAILDGSMAGDAGFDPLGLAKNQQYLMIFREAEIKHSRLAMLAALGWPLSELLDAKIAKIFNIAPTLDEDGKAPSLSNNFEGITDEFWFGVLAFAAVVDIYGTYRAFNRDDNYFPGNLGFDPLGLYPGDAREQKVMQLAEIKHGRTAMIAVLIYALEEGLTDGTTINGEAFEAFL